MRKPHSTRAEKTGPSALVERACVGEKVTISHGSFPAVPLSAIDREAPGRQFGAMRGRAKVRRAFFEPLADDELARWGG